jgi:hypothetical protein
MWSAKSCGIGVSIALSISSACVPHRPNVDINGLALLTLPRKNRFGTQIDMSAE